VKLVVVVVVDGVGCGGGFRQRYLQIFLFKVMEHVPPLDRADLFQNKTTMIVSLVF